MGKTMKISVSQVMKVLVLLTGAIAGPVFSQDSQVNAEPEASLQAEAGVESVQLPYVTIEEIRVTAERSAFVLRQQLEAAREDFYASYNDVNNVDEFDINCKKTDWTHTRIQEQICLPVFFERAVADEAQMGLINGDFVMIALASLAKAESRRFEQLQNHVLQVALEYPYLANSMLEMGKIQAALTIKKEECMARPGFLGIFRLCR